MDQMPVFNLPTCSHVDNLAYCCKFSMRPPKPTPCLYVQVSRDIKFDIFTFCFLAPNPYDQLLLGENTHMKAYYVCFSN